MKDWGTKLHVICSENEWGRMKLRRIVGVLLSNLKAFKLSPKSQTQSSAGQAWKRGRNIGRNGGREFIGGEHNKQSI